MGGCCSKAKKVEKQQESESDEESQGRSNSPTASIHTPESFNEEALKSFSPGDNEEEKAYDERQRLKKCKKKSLILNRQSSAENSSKSTKSSSSSESPVVSLITPGTGPSSVRGSSSTPHSEQGPCKCNKCTCSSPIEAKGHHYPKMSTKMQEEIKNKSASIQSRRLSSMEGETPTAIEVHATLQRAKGPSQQRPAPLPPPVQLVGPVHGPKSAVPPKSTGPTQGTEQGVAQSKEAAPVTGGPAQSEGSASKSHSANTSSGKGV